LGAIDWPGAPTPPIADGSAVVAGTPTSGAASSAVDPAVPGVAGAVTVAVEVAGAVETPCI
jgi:hypothetical protein